MITAQEARELVIVSDKNVEHHLSKVDKKIREAATLGKTSLELYELGLTVEGEAYSIVNPTPLMLRVHDALKKAGFNAEIKTAVKENTRSRGLGIMADDEDDTPVRKKLCSIFVQW